LVTALDPLLRRQNGLWVSASEVDPDSEFSDLGYRQRLVVLPEQKVSGFYSEFSNGVLWPTLHGFPTIGQVDDAPWSDYEDANRCFAEAALEYTSDEDLLWVHDYHLMRTPLLARNTQAQLRIGWFCHIPWPDVDQFATLPWRRELVEGVLGANVIGFHSARYGSHFLDCAEQFGDVTVDREASVVEGAHGTSSVIIAPIGIPRADVRALVESETVQQRGAELKSAVHGRRIVLGVDRLDYTKGIPERLSAFARLLEQRPALSDQVVLIQIVVPSRESVGAYAELKERLDQLVGQLNGQLSRTGQVPIHYIYRSLATEELYAHYLAADVALVTPLRDGMNLVALEYIASRIKEDGALVLSEFAGAAEHLAQAYLVNPYDIDSVANILGRALDAPPEENTRRMRALRAALERLDVHDWAATFQQHLRSRAPASPSRSNATAQRAVGG
jgi:trehalose 6-phosphate synthase/phosphatase